MHVYSFKSPLFTLSNISLTWRLTKCLPHVINLLWHSNVGGYCPRQCALANFLLAHRLSALLASLSTHILAQKGIDLHTYQSVLLLILPSGCQVDSSPMTFCSNLPQGSSPRVLYEHHPICPTCLPTQLSDVVTWFSIIVPHHNSLITI